MKHHRQVNSGESSSLGPFPLKQLPPGLMSDCRVQTATLCEQMQQRQLGKANVVAWTSSVGSALASLPGPGQLKGHPGDFQDTHLSEEGFTCKQKCYRSKFKYRGSG